MKFITEATDATDATDDRKGTEHTDSTEATVCRDPTHSVDLRNRIGYMDRMDARHAPHVTLDTRH